MPPGIGYKNANVFDPDSDILKRLIRGSRPAIKGASDLEQIFDSFGSIPQDTVQQAAQKVETIREEPFRQLTKEKADTQQAPGVQTVPSKKKEETGSGGGFSFVTPAAAGELPENELSPEVRELVDKVDTMLGYRKAEKSKERSVREKQRVFTRRSQEQPEEPQLPSMVERVEPITEGIPQISEKMGITPDEGNEFIDQIAQHEGFRSRTYKDTKGIPTIGIGFNLKKDTAREQLEELGYNYNAILNGEQEVTREDAITLAIDDVETAIDDARVLFPNFDELSPVRKRVLVDMAYNMGRARFGAFEDMREAVSNKQWAKAAAEMIDSEWYGDVKRRGKTLVEMMRSGKPAKFVNFIVESGGR